MKRLNLVLLIFLGVSSYLHSQNLKIEKIINTCKEIDDKIAEEGDYRNYIMIHTINYESNVRAIGKQNTSLKFYYTQPQDTLIDNGQESIVVDKYKPPLKISIEYNVAASQNIKINYYLDENGKLIFYYFLTKGYYTCGEEQYFFYDEKPVSIKIKSLNNCIEILEKYKNYEKEAGFTKEDETNSIKIIKKADDYKKLFDQIIYAEKIDK